jgi:Na+-transporting NADH:ubiquinone oxidoreductase subunit D
MPAPGEQVNSKQAVLIQLWEENPIFKQVLGICSALAVTNRMFNTLLMCGGLIWATTMSSLTVSLLRNYTPKRVRIMVNVLIIAVYVICVDIALRAYFPEIHKDIAAYVGLIITNCIVLGRLEAFASKSPPAPAVADGLGAGLGYSFILMAVALVRELLGFGTLFGIELGGFTQYWQDTSAQWVIMIMPPGAFFVLAMVVWAVKSIDLRRQARAEASQGGAK